MINIVLCVAVFVLLKAAFLMLFARDHRHSGAMSPTDAISAFHSDLNLTEEIDEKDVAA
jgi:hypothetical protein